MEWYCMPRLWVPHQLFNSTSYKTTLKSITIEDNVGFEYFNFSAKYVIQNNLSFRILEQESSVDIDATHWVRSWQASIYGCHS